MLPNQCYDPTLTSSLDFSLLWKLPGDEVYFGDDHDDDYTIHGDYDDDDDLYIMVKCVCVCHEKVTKFV